jgi:cytochrome c
MTLYLRSFALFGLLLIVILFCTGCTQGPATAPAQISAPTIAREVGEPTSAASITAVLPMATKEEMVAFVKEAVAYARLNGKEKALAEFSNPKGSFFRGMLYIYAYDYNGTTIAHPVNPEKIGINRLHEKDAEGNLFIQDLRQTAYHGTGFSTYYYINPVHNNAVEKKLGYAMSVDETWWLGSGIYQGPAATPLQTVNKSPSAAGIAITLQGK